jgi:hypothetical protein
MEGCRMINVVPIKPTSISHGLIHVWRQDTGQFEVHDESASGSSFALLARFASDEREQAVQAALDALPTYAPCKLGEVPSWV